jgi:predicted sulfurtransferase
LKRDGVQIQDKVSGTALESRLGDTNSKYGSPGDQDTRWMTDKAKYTVLIDNRNCYESMIMMHTKVIEPMQKRIAELKEHIIQNELKVRTVL